MATPRRPERTLEFDFEGRLDSEGHGAKVSKASRRALALATAAVVGGLIGGGAALWAVASNFNPLSDVDQARAAGGQLAFVQQAVTTVYSGSPGFDGLDAALLVRSGQLPSAMVSGGRIRHAFRGDVSVGPDETGGYWVAFDGVPAKQCALVASMNLGSALQAVTVAAASGERTSGGGPFGHEAALRACGRDGAAKVSWRFR